MGAEKAPTCMCGAGTLPGTFNATVLVVLDRDPTAFSFLDLYMLMRLLKTATLSHRACSTFARSQSSWDTLTPQATLASAARSSGEQDHSPSLPATPGMGGSSAALCPWLVQTYLAHKGGAQSGWQAQAASGKHVSKCTIPSTAPRGWSGPAAAATCSKILSQTRGSRCPTEEPPYLSTQVRATNCAAGRSTIRGWAH